MKRAGGIAASKASSNNIRSDLVLELEFGLKKKEDEILIYLPKRMLQMPV